MSPFLIALLVFVALGLGLTLALRRTPSASPVANQARGASQLGQLRWRDFTKHVLQVMQARGYRPVIEAGMPADGIPTDGGDILLERNGERTLLSCKYGSASVVGAQSLLGLKQSASLRGADNVVVITPGRFEQEAERLARQQEIELIDGEDLWPEVRPYIAHPENTATEEPKATAPSFKGIAIAWGGAAVAAGIAWMLAQGMSPEPGVDTTTTFTPTPAATAAAPAAQAPAAPAEAAPADEVPTDPEELARRRVDAANAISTLFGVERAIWSTQSTLLVHLTSENADPSGELCPLLVRYPELAASRVQLQPPQGSTRPVRFKQCRSY